MPKQIFSNRLAARLAVILTLAIVPLGSLALYSEYSSWNTQAEANESQLIARTVDATTGQRALLASVSQESASLAPRVVDRLGDPEACSAFLADYVSASSFFAFAGFINVDGMLVCASEGSGADLGDSENFALSMSQTQTNFRFQESGRVTGLPVVLVNRPVFDGDELLGLLTISVTRATLDLIATRPNPSTDPKIVYLVNSRGNTLTYSNDPAAADLLPSETELQQLIAQGDGLFNGTSLNGNDRVFTIATLMPGQLFALGSWSPDNVRALLRPDYTRLLLPVAMWIASVGVLMLSIHYMVVRHLRQLNAQLRRFALGDRSDFARLPSDAPTELREIDSTFSKMARLIRRDEDELEEALREKTVLLMEVHHRVKNNLQLIASILNLQMRRMTDPEARAILKGVQARVRALASIHRALYEETRVSDIDATAFLQSILQDTLAMAGADRNKLVIETQFQPVALPADKIIPAAMLFAEALTNALKYATVADGDESPRIVASISAKDGAVELRVRNSLAQQGVQETEKGLGSELMTAFALQIGAQLDVGPVDDEAGPGWEIRLRVDDAGMNPGTPPSGPQSAPVTR
ncbi:MULTISPECIES: sensor histidine kinase [unclassified Yoonia]|uniref:sensor histidine kinase n=1 Tax=unclassified Yoonia TaxID=2629118 RepID=UPI002AFE0D35|nr:MULTISPECIES: histidine kinase dimerization/phosphoacceptor domain -containing protein [unclassified Yoonia]